MSHHPLIRSVSSDNHRTTRVETFQTVEAAPGRWEIFSLSDPEAIIESHDNKGDAISRVTFLNKHGRLA